MISWSWINFSLLLRIKVLKVYLLLPFSFSYAYFHLNPWPRAKLLNIKIICQKFGTKNDDENKYSLHCGKEHLVSTPAHFFFKEVHLKKFRDGWQKKRKMMRSCFNGNLILPPKCVTFFLILNEKEQNTLIHFFLWLKRDNYDWVVLYVGGRSSTKMVLGAKAETGCKGFQGD